MNFKINNAIISCYDKKGINDFAEKIVELNPDMKIFSSSGTFKTLSESVKSNLVEISDYIGFKEMPSGLVKTLHPKIHSGILANVEDQNQKEYLEKNSIKKFDLVVVNLYPFKKTIDDGKPFETVRQNIDIGGVSLLESASKNFIRVIPICNPEDYDLVIQELKTNNLGIESRLNLAKKSFSYLNNYFNDLNNYFSKLNVESVK